MQEMKEEMERERERESERERVEERERDSYVMYDKLCIFFKYLGFNSSTAPNRFVVVVDIVSFV